MKGASATFCALLLVLFFKTVEFMASHLSLRRAGAWRSPTAAVCGEALEERRLLALQGEVALETVTSALSGPVTATHAGDGSGRIFVAEQGGAIRIIDDGVLLPTPFLDISDRILSGGEKGLLGLAFHPEYATPGGAGEGKFYVYYSDQKQLVVQGPHDHDSVVAEYRVSAADPNMADEDSERVVLRFAQPFVNHNGGDLKFGPDDGLLYISSGDGGSGGDPQNNAQNLGTLLGKILRIDVNGNNAPGGQYGIPAANPFVDQAGARDEIFAYGFRNPFRISFDDGVGGAAETDRLFVGDVGQTSWEEVDLVTAGGNYGWRIREGAHPFNTTDPNPGNLIDPIAEYPNPMKGDAVIGGFVYRGQESPGLQGVYVFGDLRGRLFALEETGGGAFELSEPIVVGGNPLNAFIHGFGEDEAGEIYVLTTDSMLHITLNEPESPWRNPDVAEDIDGVDGVQIEDMLPIIDFLRDHGVQDLRDTEVTPDAAPYLDPTGDRRVSVVDLLAVVQFLRRRLIAEGEGESPASTPDRESAWAPDEWLRRVHLP
jgi:glucose/arabinose dehydrogenase